MLIIDKIEKMEYACTVWESQCKIKVVHFDSDDEVDDDNNSDVHNVNETNDDNNNDVS